MLSNRVRSVASCSRSGAAASHVASRVPALAATASGRCAFCPASTALSRSWLRRSGSRFGVGQLNAASADAPSTSGTSAKLPPDNYNLALLRLFGLSVGTLLGAYTLHPVLLDTVTNLWNLDSEGEATGSYESNFFSFVSIVYAIMIGNTFTFLYQRQEHIISELYREVFCVEVLLQEICLAVNEPATRLHLISYLRQYVVEELYNPLEMQSPFQAGSPLLAILNAIRSFRKRGRPEVSGMLRACESLAAAQSSRSASASQILPGVHWLFIYSVLFLLVVTSLVFEATSANPNLESRRLIFSAECGLLAVIVQLLQDLAKPLDGLYTFRGALDVRLSYVVEELDRCLSGSDAVEAAEQPPQEPLLAGIANGAAGNGKAAEALWGNGVEYVEARQ